MNITEKIGFILFIVSVFAIYDTDRLGVDRAVPPFFCIVGILVFCFGG